MQVQIALRGPRPVGQRQIDVLLYLRGQATKSSLARYTPSTFNSHLGGEEQALFGLVDHAGTPSWKVYEWARFASEFRQLSKLGFPRYMHPEVAIAYSFDSFIDSKPNGPSSTTLQYFKPSYTDQVQGAFEPFFSANIDTAIVNVGHADLSSYKLVVVPADFLLDPASAKALRAYVREVLGPMEADLLQ